jgi:cysteine synthase
MVASTINEVSKLDRLANSVCSPLGRIGDTPLVELHSDRPFPPGVRLFAMLETVNSGGLLKDRPAARSLRCALERGDLDTATLVARRGRHRSVFTLLNDTGERYGSMGIWERVARANRSEAAPAVVK